MKRILVHYLCAITLTFAIPQAIHSQEIPFSTNPTNLTIWNGSEYIPFFINGTNLGIAIPGTFPGELAANNKHYGEWFTSIKDAGLNCVRIYTLHYPHFYEVLDSFNLANPQHPLLFIQGVWLNELLPKQHDDLHHLTDTFGVEVEENIDAVHGNRVIPKRRGKAYGIYSTDVSKWCLAYIIGREVFSKEVLKTNKNHAEDSTFSGHHFSISNSTATEVWFVSQLDNLVDYESKNYNTQRPVSISSWPTLDPLPHPEEINRAEDTASMNLSEITLTDAPAGLFMSYNVYPHYPNFISQQSDYLNYSDSQGANSYKGYLSNLKAHYSNYPLIITEYGASSSWGVAHYTSSGMNYGGFDEIEQGNANVRMLATIEDSNCGGGIQFAWIDEWFKPTWISHPIDHSIENRILWHNIAAAEQNFGLFSFNEAPDLQSLKRFRWFSKVSELKTDANYTFFELEIALKRPINAPYEIWIALDTYAGNLGECLLPGGEAIPFRSEFLLHIKDKSAQLYVTEAYDIYGIGHHNAAPTQLFHSIASKDAPWHLVKWKNNGSTFDLKHIGNLQVNYNSQNNSSKDGVIIDDNKIHLRLPWSLLNVVAPHQLKVLHDDRQTPEREDTITEGFNIGIYYKNKWFTTDQRFLWTGWDSIDPATLIKSPKMSYLTTKSEASQFNSSPIAMRDTFTFENNSSPRTVDSSSGVLKNDYDLDGQIMVALMATQPLNGHVDLHNDGSFSYYPKNYFNGLDSMKYLVFDGYSLSKANTVVFNVKGNKENKHQTSQQDDFISISSQSESSIITIHTANICDELSLFNATGQTIHTFEYGKNSYKLDYSNLSTGVYILMGKYNDKYYSKKALLD